MELVTKKYRKTELGLIPSDWKVKTLVECCSKITDGTHDTPKPIEEGIPFLTAIHVKENSIDFKGCYYLPEEIHRTIYKRCNSERDDVLMVNIGAGVATTALVNVDYEFSLKNVALLKPNNSTLIGSYLNYWQLKAKSKIINSISTGGAQPFLSLKQIGELQIALPTVEEQTTIAEALRDADTLVTSLEKLIAKKRNIKQGAMQKLLTPPHCQNHRLNGLKDDTDLKSVKSVQSVPVRDSDKWEVKKLGEIAIINKGEQINNDELTENDQYPLMNGGMSPSGYTFKWNTAENTIVISEGGNSCGFVNYMTQKFWRGGHCYEVDTKMDKKFLYQLLKFKEKLIMSLRVGSGLPNIQKNRIESLSLVIPNQEDQIAIAQVLSDMDAEVESLERKLEKCKILKQGMMQELLTGKVRLNHR